jgi:hypothetical protein
MHTHRFGRKLKLPSTVAIKHGILRMMLQEELKAQALPQTQTRTSLLTAGAERNRHSTPKRCGGGQPRQINSAIQ